MRLLFSHHQHQHLSTTPAQSTPPGLYISQQPGSYYAMDGQRPSISHQRGVTVPTQPPASQVPSIPRQPGCYYVEDGQQSSTGRHHGTFLPLRDHYLQDDFQADHVGSFREVLMRMLNSGQEMDWDDARPSSTVSELSWMDEFLKTLDATSQNGGGQVPGTPPAAMPVQQPLPSP